MTIKKLQQQLEHYSIPKSWYCLTGYREEAYGIHHDNKKWIVHVCERNQFTGFERFESESEACEYLLAFLRKIHQRKSPLVKVMKGLRNLLPLKPATDDDVSFIESSLNLDLADEYIGYIKAYGAVLAEGLELTGFARSESTDVIQVTKTEWLLNDKVPHNLYVVENIGVDGIIIWQDSRGYVYQSAPHQEPIKIANSLINYLNRRRERS